MNSAVQLIRGIPPLVDLIATHKQRNTCKLSADRLPCVVCALDDTLASKLSKEESKKTLQALLLTMRRFEKMEAGSVDQQHDAGQVFLSLVEEVRRQMYPNARGIPGFSGASCARQRRCKRCKND